MTKKEIEERKFRPARQEARDAQRIIETPQTQSAAYRLAFAREATAEDLRRAENYLTAADASLNSTQQDSTKREQEVWALLCQALMMSNEFIYLR